MMEKWEQYKAELAIRLQWIGWGTVLVMALLFFFLNWKPVQLHLIFGTFETSGALVFAGIFFIGWSLGKIYRYTADRVNAIQERYREKMAILHKTGAMEAAEVTSPVSAPAPTVPLYAQTASGATAAPAAEPPKPAETPIEAPKTPEKTS